MTGIRNGMVMQRGADGTCAIYLESEQPVTTVTYAADCAPKEARAVPCGSGRWQLRGIPVGGPYTVTVDGTAYTDVYVGDVWLLAGQSNMEGVGWLMPEDEAFAGDPAVRAFYMTDTWDTANHPLHVLGLAVDKVHEALGAVPGEPARFNCVGPGLAFARKMKTMTGVPQGVICCAHGGTSMAQWSPELKGKGGEGSLYGAMLRRFLVNGASARGLFWYQGCSDACHPACDEFTSSMKALVAECRRDFGEALPVVQVQIGRHTDNNDRAVGWLCWNAVRDRQRRLHEEITGLLTVSAVSAALDDGIHLCGADQARLGREAAEAMYTLLYNEDDPAPRDGTLCLPPPQYAGHTVRADRFGRAVVEVRYTNLHGGRLAAGSRPAGFVILAPKGDNPPQLVFDILLEGDTAQLRTGLSPEDLKGKHLHYGYGADPYCNITDAAGRSIPGMGPIAL